ncbi:hypothetical protein [Catenuloplanes japonicus]|uniref:hypothetical protein n=1 Tax=Catenuloplanes japonicus TaxID=33876 RepID=UPI000689E9E7|nr:hypothetical protein [Catenuloplanes japonicus]
MATCADRGRRGCWAPDDDAGHGDVRSWLGIDVEQRVTAERIIGQNRHELYSGGWAFPSAPFNWSLYLFYGGDIRQGELSWLRGQVEQLAEMPPVDEDNDWPRGLFVVTAEERDGAQICRSVRLLSRNCLPPSLSWLCE